MSRRRESSGYAKPDPIGDSALLPATIDAIPVDLLGRDYGDDFATTLVALPLGAWRGPIASGYGMHLVRINTKTPGRPATLAELWWCGKKHGSLLFKT